MVIKKSQGGVGETLCPECDHDYTDWLNFESYAKWYWKNVGDGGCGGPRHA